jgi:hypothetical protein
VDEEPSVDGMMNGVQGSCALLLILTDGVLTRPFVQLELVTALLFERPVVMVYETDVRKQGFAPMDQIIKQAPMPIATLFELFVAIAYRRESYERVSMIQRTVSTMRTPLILAIREHIAANETKLVGLFSKKPAWINELFTKLGRAAPDMMPPLSNAASTSAATPARSTTATTDHHNQPIYNNNNPRTVSASTSQPSQSGVGVYNNNSIGNMNTPATTAAATTTHSHSPLHVTPVPARSPFGNAAANILAPDNFSSDASTSSTASGYTNNSVMTNMATPFYGSSPYGSVPHNTPHNTNFHTTAQPNASSENGMAAAVAFQDYSPHHATASRVAVVRRTSIGHGGASDLLAAQHNLVDWFHAIPGLSVAPHTLGPLCASLVASGFDCVESMQDMTESDLSLASQGLLDTPSIHLILTAALVEFLRASPALVPYIIAENYARAMAAHGIIGPAGLVARVQAKPRQLARRRLLERLGVSHGHQPRILRALRLSW